MPCDTVTKLPRSVKDNLPKHHAQEIYKEAYNSAWDQYKDSKDRRGDTLHEKTAHRVAWSSAKNKYTKNDDGKWVEKDDEL